MGCETWDIDVEEEQRRGDKAIDTLLADRELMKKVLEHIVLTHHGDAPVTHLASTIKLGGEIRDRLGAVEFVMLCQSF